MSRPLPCIQMESVALATSTSMSTWPLKRGCAGSMVNTRSTALGTTVRGNGPVGTAPSAGGLAGAGAAAAVARPVAATRAVASRVRRKGIGGILHGNPPETTPAAGRATLTEVLAVHRALQRRRQRGITVDEVPPGQFHAVAAPLLDQLQAHRVDGQGVGLVFDLDLAAQRLVECSGHAGSSRGVVAIEHGGRS